MSACRFEELEAYVFDELGRERTAAIEAHLTSCARCAREVGSLRAERQLFTGRASTVNASLPSFDRVLDHSRATPPKRPAIARLWSSAWGRRHVDAAGRGFAVAAGRGSAIAAGRGSAVAAGRDSAVAAGCGSVAAGTRPRAAGLRAHTALAMCSAMAVLVLAVRATHYDRAVTIAPTQAAPIEELTMSAPEPRALACYDVDPIAVDESTGAFDKATALVEDEYGACLVATPVSVGALTCDAPPL